MCQHPCLGFCGQTPNHTHQERFYDDYNAMFGSVLTAYLQDYKGMFTGTYKKGTKLTDKDFKKMEEHCELLRHKGMTVTIEFHTDYAGLTVLM